jgi:lipopolysaccharide export system protein LptA
MAEIKTVSFILKIFQGRHLLPLSVIFLLSFTFQPQDLPNKNTGKRRIDLKNADIDYIERDRKTGKDWHRLLGNVFLQHNEITMKCDSAHFYPDKNQVTAYNRIHIEQGDTLDIYGDYLFYDGATESALLTGNVELVDKETHLFTNKATYDVKNRIAQYTDSGRIINGNNKLTSKIGIYYVSENMFHFKDSVKIVNPDYIMTADTMDYNTETETAFFTGPSEMKGDSIYLYCEKGWYDTKNNVTRIWKNAIIDNKKQLVDGDSLHYDDNTGYGEAFGDISITDTSKRIIVKVNYALYYRQPERFLVTDSAMFIQVSKSDSMFLHADTISSITVSDTSVGYRLMRAFHGCRIFSKGFQSKCDSLSYSFRDSVIRLYIRPVIWSEENQLTSDSMAIFTLNSKTERMELYNSAFVTSKVDSLRYNQIKGRSLTGYFKDNELYKIDVIGNGESIYYLIDGEDIVGVNTTRCASIEIYVENGKIVEIYERQSPEGVIDPPVMRPGPNLLLPGFNWLDSIRPNTILDIFL